VSRAARIFVIVVIARSVYVRRLRRNRTIKLMRRLAALISMCSLSAAVTFAQVREVFYQGYNLTEQSTFDHGYLAVYRLDYRVDLFSPEGTLLHSVAAQVPGADRATVWNAAVDSDGKMALAVRGIAGPGYWHGAGIALFDPTGRQIRFIDTGDYLPAQVAFGPDHSIWSIGWLGDGPASITPGDYMTLRNYSPDGRQLGAFLPRSTLPTVEYRGVEEPIITPCSCGWELRVVNDNVEVVLRRAQLWVQTDLNGKEKRRWAIRRIHDGPGDDSPEVATSLYRPSAFTDDGKAWRKDGHQLKLFDRSAGVWNEVAFNIPDGALLGAEGNDLVFLSNDKRTVRRLPAPGEPVLSTGQR
jgi:hypothetical protein